MKAPVDGEARSLQHSAPLAPRPAAAYLQDMSGIAFVLFGIAAVTTLVVLFSGLFVMARGGELNRKYGNKLMRWRIIAQGAALLLFALAMLTKDG